MSKLLVINSSPMGDNSVSRRLTSHFIDTYKTKHPDTQVSVLDAVALNLPHLNAEIVGSFFTPTEHRNDVQSKHAKRSADLISQFIEADAIVIGAPMHNFGIPSALKAYIDHILRAGETFKYTENGPVGLVEDKPVYIIGTRGGDYSENGYPQLDFVLPYLKSVLGFIGIQNVTTLQANGLAMGEDAVKTAIANVNSQIENLIAA